MNPIEAAILGFLQGATEFLPVSSSGHLAMGQEILGLEVAGITLEVFLHVATLISVVIVYRERLMALMTGCFIHRDPATWKYVGLLALATLPAAVVGILFQDAIEGAFAEPAAVGIALLATGALLFSTRWALRRPLIAPLGARAAFAIGCAQCVALIPGISRSGSTVAAALWLGIPPVEAAAFSFLMSIPTIGGAAVLQFPELTHGAGGVGAFPLAVGFAVAGITGILAIRFFLRMLRVGSFAHFAWYCWGAGSLFLIWLVTR